MTASAEVFCLSEESWKIRKNRKTWKSRWKLKGLAIATLKPERGGARIRLDGLTYGGFRKEDSPHNAEDFMKALLSLYKGEIVDYEEIPDAGGPPARKEDEKSAV